MKVSLIVARGQAAGLEVPVSSPEFVIGRNAQCQLRPASSEVSRRHCAVIQHEWQVLVHDLNSTNGTFVNGIRVDDDVPVFDGDTLQIGPLVFTIKIQPEEAERAVGSRDAAATLLPVQDSAELLINELARADSEHAAGVESKRDLEDIYKSGFHYWETQFKHGS